MKIVSVKPHSKADKKAANVMEKLVNFEIEKLLKNDKFKLRMILGSDFDIEELEEYLALEKHN